MEIDWVMISRLVVAGVLGGLIGLEREFRAKEAGVRTHFIVALGSALFMIISQFAFGDQQHDAARVAAQVVSGIGFIGAGVIIFQKNSIRGITTAAGLWVAAAIGLACGAGMYVLATAASVLTILVLELMNLVNKYFSEKLVELTLTTDKPVDPVELRKRLKDMKIDLESFSFSNGEVHISVRHLPKDYYKTLDKIMHCLEGFTIKEMN